MPVPERSHLQVVAVVVPLPEGVLAYTGPGPGLELTPYTLALLAWVGLAFLAVLLWPITVLIRRFRKSKVEPSDPAKSDSVMAPEQNATGENSPSTS